MSNLLDQLDPCQREAVTTTEGPVLVLAGAGSGKTRVITYRIAYLIEQGLARPQEILAVTFTNKAAEEMRQRVERLLPGGLPSAPMTSTFHSFCARLLRREAPTLGWKRDFSIYDADDQQRLVRNILKEFGEDDRAWVARGVLERISRSKTAGRSPDDWEGSANPQDRRHAPVFARYRQALRAAQALDFDDLLLEAARLLSEYPEARSRWQRRFRYLLVDEYQDTNRVQYELVRLLAPPASAQAPPASAQAPRPSGQAPTSAESSLNVCVVGDEDQSIYAWRGADYGNILRFEQDFPGARLILLEQNYRSTQPILDAATAVISHNSSRKGKVLWSERKEGTKVRLYEAQDAEQEAQFVAEKIWKYQGENPEQRIAVLYRTNAQSRLYEEVLRRLEVAYRVVGGFSFYKRLEIRHLLAYLRVARNTSDEQSLLLILNVPPRGIGAVTAQALRREEREREAPLWKALEESPNEKLRKFRALIVSLQEELGRKPLPEVLEFALRETGYERWLTEQNTPEAEGRLENLHELIAAARESAERGETPAEFLDRAALVSDADDYDAAAPITLMTLHSAKGTEFDLVFLVGLEEGLFPHSRSLGSEAEIEEERRLCYVGLTRAKSDLYLTRALARRSWAGTEAETNEPSRFLEEIPEELLEREERARTPAAAAPGAWRYEPVEVAGFQARRSYPKQRRRRRSNDDLTPRPPRRRRDPDYPPGCEVRHATFGAGTVVAVDGSGADKKIVVQFTGYGRKTLMEKYAGLERV